MTITEIAGFVGAGLAGAAYVPQISHPIRARGAADISRLAFQAWLLASVLTTSRTVAIGAGVFIVLGGIQIAATALIMLFGARYKDTPCPSHLPRPPGAKTAAGTGSSGGEPGAWRAPGLPVAESAAPAGHGGALRADLPTGTHVRRPAARPPLSLETSLPGVFAAGDVRRGSVKRVASAVGEGAVTVPLVHRHLARTAAGRKTLTSQHARRIRAHDRDSSGGPGNLAHAHRAQRDRHPRS
jgi:hypothetical protein